jgi:hypothetical protein
MLNELSPRRGQESVSPLVLYLASSGCQINGEAYSALAGRYSRVFMGLTDGWTAAEIADVSPEAIAEHLDTIRDTSAFTAPASMAEEIEAVVQHLRA